MLTRVAFTVLVALVSAQRLWETRKSRAHSRALLRDAAAEHASAQMPWMIALHASWLVAMSTEVWLFGAALQPVVALVAGLFFAAGQALRIFAMRALGTRWTVTVVTPTDGRPPITTGVYRYLRHPNYLGVILEVAALPAIHGAYVTSVVFSLLNGILLTFRIHAEERAIDRYAPYREAFAERPRLIPRFHRRARGRVS